MFQARDNYCRSIRIVDRRKSGGTMRPIGGRSGRARNGSEQFVEHGSSSSGCDGGVIMGELANGARVSRF